MYLASLQARGWATASVQSAARAVRAFSNFLVVEEMIEHAPMQRVKLPKADRRKLDAFTQMKSSACWRQPRTGATRSFCSACSTVAAE